MMTALQERERGLGALASATRSPAGAGERNGKNGSLHGSTYGAAERTLRRTVREDGICVLTLDRPGSSANVFDRRALTELGEELDFVESAPALKGLIIISAKKTIFVAGADLKSISEHPEDAPDLVELGQSVMFRLGALRIPTVAAINGAAVGGGYELCLACDYRIASTDKATRVGLPETQIGLLPAWGGATRLPRLVGMPKALDIIVAGKTLDAKRALKAGMVDELAPPEYLLDTASACRNRSSRPLARHLGPQDPRELSRGGQGPRSGHSGNFQIHRRIVHAGAEGDPGTHTDGCLPQPYPAVPASGAREETHSLPPRERKWERPLSWRDYPSGSCRRRRDGSGHRSMAQFKGH